MNPFFRPNAARNTGLTAAVNDATVTATAERASISGGSVLMICAGVQPIFVTFGGSGVVADGTTGIYLPANAVVYLGVPNGATHLSYVRAGGTDSSISLIPGDMT
jgi:hypothetical protein